MFEIDIIELRKISLVPQPGFEPGLPRPQRGVLTTRRLRRFLHQIVLNKNYLLYFTAVGYYIIPIRTKMYPSLLIEICNVESQAPTKPELNLMVRSILVNVSVISLLTVIHVPFFSHLCDTRLKKTSSKIKIFSLREEQWWYFII